MARVKHNFYKVSISRTKNGICLVCGKRASRSRCFWQTLNPLNTLDDGTIKSVKMIRDELKEQANDWEKSTVIVHARCEEQICESQ
jgi:hypothetical protein